LSRHALQRNSKNCKDQASQKARNDRVLTRGSNPYKNTHIRKMETEEKFRDSLGWERGVVGARRNRKNSEVRFDQTSAPSRKYDSALAGQREEEGLWDKEIDEMNAGRFNHSISLILLISGRGSSQ